MDYNSKIAGQVIGRLRQQRGWTQDVMSGFVPMSRSHLAMIECGKNVNIATLWKIAEALQIRTSDLIRMIEEEIEKQNS